MNLATANPESSAFTRWGDAAAQILVSSPVAIQMLFLLAVVVPIAIVLAWVLMFTVDRAAGVRRKGGMPRAAMKNPVPRGTKIITHVEPQSRREASPRE